MNNKPTICSENTCTLCKACVSICPVGCVVLEKDVLNNEYAVKGEKCINCNLCEKVCPANKETYFNDIKMLCSVVIESDHTKTVSIWRNSN